MAVRKSDWFAIALRKDTFEILIVDRARRMQAMLVEPVASGGSIFRFTLEQHWTDTNHQ